VANPQPTPFVQFSKELFDALLLSPMPAGHKEIVLAVIRRTYGDHGRKAAPVSLSLLSAMTGRTKGNISRSLKALREQGVLRLASEPSFASAAVYTLNKDYESWGIWSCPVVNSRQPATVIKSTTPTVIKSTTIEDKRDSKEEKIARQAVPRSQKEGKDAGTLTAHWIDGMRESDRIFTSSDKGRFAKYAKEVLDAKLPYDIAVQAVDRLIERNLGPHLLGQIANEIRGSTDANATPEGKQRRFERLKASVGAEAAKEAVYG